MPLRGGAVESGAGENAVTVQFREGPEQAIAVGRRVGHVGSFGKRGRGGSATPSQGTDAAHARHRRHYPSATGNAEPDGGLHAAGTACPSGQRGQPPHETPATPLARGRVW